MHGKLIRKRPLYTETDYVRLKQRLCDDPGALSLDEADLDILRGGIATYCWESPLAGTVGEAAELARQAALEMTPRPGRVIRSAILYIMGDSRSGLETVERISSVIQSAILDGATTILGTKFFDGQKGIRFLLVTSEEYL